MERVRRIHDRNDGQEDRPNDGAPNRVRGVGVQAKSHLSSIAEQARPAWLARGVVSERSLSENADAAGAASTLTSTRRCHYRPQGGNSRASSNGGSSSTGTGTEQSWGLCSSGYSPASWRCSAGRSAGTSVSR
jgi:hypothetical protein